MSSHYLSRFTRVPRLLYVLALATLFVATAGFRFVALATGFGNDHFLYLAQAQQMLSGEWPTRDFLDPGLPFMYAASALAQLIFGRTLFAEGVLVSVAFGLAAVLTAAAVRSLTGSRTIAIAAAVLSVLIMPRAYGYPKLLWYAVAFLLIQRYVTRPTTGRLLAIAFTVTIAFLFRHDHGIYLGVGGVLVALLAPADVPPVRRALTFIGMVAAMTAPYLLYVQIYRGLWSYLEIGLEYRRVELVRQAFAWPSLFGDRWYEGVLFFGFWSLPVVTVLVLLTVAASARGRATDASTIVARLAPIAVVAVLVNWTFLRDPLSGRLPDAIVPAVVLGAWLTACGWRARLRWVWTPVSVLAFVFFASAVLEVGAISEHARRAGLLRRPLARWPDVMANVASTLQEPHDSKVLPSRASAALAPFYPYARRCMTRDQRLIVVGSLQEALYFSQRLYAGGQVALIQGYYGSEPYQRAVLMRLGQQTVPFVLIPGDAYQDDFDATFPLIAGYVRQHYDPLVTFGENASTGVQVLLDRRLAVPRLDPQTGWPCWRP